MNQKHILLAIFLLGSLILLPACTTDNGEIKGKIRYVPPKGGIKGDVEHGFEDKFGNIWTKGPSRTAGDTYEWDVQLSRQGKAQLGWATRDGSHLNVSLKGRITHK